MRNTKQIKAAMRELIKTIKEEMNDSRNSYIEHFMPAEGRHIEYNDEAGRNITYYLDEDECLERGKEAILDPGNEEWFREFVEQGEIQDKAIAFIRLIAERV